MSDVENVSVYKNLAILFLLLNAVFLYLLYGAFFGMEIEFLAPLTDIINSDFKVLFYTYCVSAFLGLSYVFLLIKKYGISLTFAVMPQFAFIGALCAVFL